MLNQILIMKSVFLVIIIGAGMLVSCSKKKQVDLNDDLSANEEQLVGTWRHVFTEGGILPGPVQGIFEWTFNEDRTGIYYQDPGVVAPASNDFFWKMDGDDIVFTDEAGNGSPQYRIDVYSDTLMKWYNYTLSDTYVVEKQ